MSDVREMSGILQRILEVKAGEVAVARRAKPFRSRREAREAGPVRDFAGALQAK